MARTSVVANDLAYLVNFDAPGRDGDRFQSIVIAMLVDEITGLLVQRSIRVETTIDALVAKVVAPGVAALTGVPSQVFPRLDVQPYTLTVRFAVDGYVNVRREVTVAQQVGFPYTFADVDLGVIPVRREPVSLIVRAVTLDPQQRPIPVSGATVQLSGVWRTTADLVGPTQPASMVALRQRFSAERSTAVTTLEPVTLSVVVEPERRLQRPTRVGDSVIEVTRTGAVGPGTVIALDRLDDDRRELVVVDHVDGPSDAESPAALVLAFPLRSPHTRDAVVEAVTIASLGVGSAALADNAATGDSLAFVASLAPFTTNPLVRVSDGVQVDEFADSAVFRITTDAAGYGRLPPLSRMAACTLTASAPGPISAQPTPFTLTYGSGENHLQMTLT